MVVFVNNNMAPEQDATPDGTGEPAARADETPCCTPVGHDLPDGAVESDARTLAAMGNETRYEVLRLLAGADGPVCSCDLAPALGVAQSTTSRGLTALYDAGLVDRRKDGRWRFYTTTPRAETMLSAIDATRGDAP